METDVERPPLLDDPDNGHLPLLPRRLPISDLDAVTVDTATVLALTQPVCSLICPRG